MRKFLLLVIGLVILAGLVKIGLVAYDYIEKKNSLRFEPIQTEDQNATSTDVATSTNIVEPKVDISKWKSYTNEEFGYGFKYPDNLILNKGDFDLFLAFPKDVYFHWPLLDNVRLSIIASSSCDRSKLLEYGNLSTTTKIIVSGKDYTMIKVDDIAAGTIFERIAYERMGNNICYSVLLESKGTNGAGFYVTDPVLVKKYDDQHKVDSEALLEIVYGILANFEIKSVPAGIDEGEI